MRVAARKDRNQDEIVTALRAVPGVSVAIIHQLGKGLGDILVGHNGKNYMFEIKDPEQPPSNRRLTEDEKLFHAAWRGQVDVIMSAEDALRIMRIIDSL